MNKLDFFTTEELEYLLECLYYKKQELGLNTIEQEQSNEEYIFNANLRVKLESFCASKHI